MKKKWILFSIAALVIISLIFFSKSQTISTTSEYCAFCDQKVLTRQTFYENEDVAALYTHKPIFPGHCLIIPKRHVTRFEDLNEKEIVAIGNAIKKVHQAASHVFGTVSYVLLEKNGKEAGQTVPHVHFHYIPRKQGDTSSLKFIYRMFLANAKKPIKAEEMQDAVLKLKENIPSSFEEGMRTL